MYSEAIQVAIYYEPECPRVVHPEYPRKWKGWTGTHVKCSHEGNENEGSLGGWSLKRYNRLSSSQEIDIYLLKRCQMNVRSLPQWYTGQFYLNYTHMCTYSTSLSAGVVANLIEFQPFLYYTLLDSQYREIAAVRVEFRKIYSEDFGFFLRKREKKLSKYIMSFKFSWSRGVINGNISNEAPS